MSTRDRLVAAGTVVVDGDAILLVREHGYWSLPKGVVEARETALVAAVRETSEETGLSVSVDELAFVTSFQADGRRHLQCERRSSTSSARNSDDSDGSYGKSSGRAPGTLARSVRASSRPRVGVRSPAPIIPMMGDRRIDARHAVTTVAEPTDRDRRLGRR